MTAAEKLLETGARERRVLMLTLKEILPGDNPRQEIDQGAMAELMQSMKHQGLLSPVGVRVLPTGRYKLVFGHRRYLAAQKLGWERIEAVEVDVEDEKDALLKTSAENVIRENVSLPEQGRIFRDLLKKGLTQEQISVRMGCSKAFVENALHAFSNIPKKFHDKITYGTRGQSNKKGTIPATVALTAVDIKKENRLTDEQVGKLMDWAAKHSINAVKMRTAGKMISDGVKPEKAMEQVEYMKSVALVLTMKISVINKLQTKYKMSIHDILYKYLADEDEFDLLPGRLEKLAKKETPSELVRKKRKRRNR